MAGRGELLVAILNNPRDLIIAREQHWYRIPIASADKWLAGRWPPQWVAFYQTQVFGDEKHAVNYYAEVLEIREAYRWQLLPDDPHRRREDRYYQLILAPLQRLPSPIVSRRLRRIVFIPTTWSKFVHAAEINDLFDESPLEDRMWDALKGRRISAERQEFVEVNHRSYALDFAIYCAKGNLNIETDGDTWHADPQRIPLDNLRDNDLETAGWKLLRFNTLQVREQMSDYCIPTIVENVNRLGGLEDGRMVPRRIGANSPDGLYQAGLFDEPRME